MGREFLVTSLIYIGLLVLFLFISLTRPSFPQRLLPYLFLGWIAIALMSNLQKMALSNNLTSLAPEKLEFLPYVIIGWCLFAEASDVLEKTLA
jgi:hypothetical protein